MTQPAQGSPLGAAREGMTVLDADGADIGTVALVKMSDPGVITGQGQDLGDTPGDVPPPPGPAMVPGIPPVGFGVGGLGAAGGATGIGTPYAAGPFGVLATGTIGAAEPDVPEEFRDPLIRTGYLKIDSKGLFRRDLYVGADQLERVQDDTLILATTKDHLIKED